jgi:hypothetical protein
MYERNNQKIMNEVHEAFVSNIYKIAYERNLSINKMDNMCDLSFGQISKRLNHHQGLSLYFLIKVSRGLGVSIDDLLK